jgi:hypothetical protein
VRPFETNIATPIIEQIVAAFAGVKYPGDWCLRGSDEGDEPYLVAEEFKGKDDWRALDSAFLDRAPNGLATALSFFSDEAFHFYLPAYMVADLRGELQCSNPTFHLTHGLDNQSSGRLVNPRRYGQRTWFDCARYKFSMFSREESAAITAYLLFKHESGVFGRERVGEALQNYWSGRAT